jgi:predicted permease
MTQSLRLTARSLLKQPGFTIACLLTLALAIGPNTAIFSIVDSVLLQPLPFRDPDRLVIVWGGNPEIAKLIGADELPVSTANLDEFQRESASFEALALADQRRRSLTGQGEPERLGTVLVTPDFFKVLGTPALFGRTLGPDDETPGAALSIVLSYNYWQRRFPGDRSVIGKKLILNGKPLTVVGVMPPRFAFPRASELPAYMSFAADPDIWEPRAFTEKERASRVNRNGFVIGRLKPGVSREVAEQELNNLNRLHAVPRYDRGWSIRVVSVADQMNGGLRPILLLLWLAGALVLLIGCVNVANLLLARSAARQKEVALRTAMGASRWRLIAQLLTESGLLSLMGGALGIFLAWAFLRLCASMIPTGLVGAATFTLDGRALVFTLLLCVLSSFLSGLVPAFQMTRPDLAGALREGARAGAGTTRSRRTRSALLVAEVAVAVVVLVGAGLLLRSFIRLMAVDPGFETDNILTFEVDMPYERPADQLASFYARLDDELRALPGAVHAGIISNLPTGGDDGFAIVEIEGKPKPEPGQLQIVAARMATPGYLDTLGMKLKEGRWLLPGDTRDQGLAAVIDEAMAEAYWPGEKVLGKRFKRTDVADSPMITVVGIVGNVRHQNLYDAAPHPTLYMTPDQFTKFYMYNTSWGVVRTRENPMALASSVRQAVYRVDPNQPVALVRPFEDVVNQSITRSRLGLLLLSILAALALILAMVGIYGITSYSVAQRRREIGLRMALGAQRMQVLKLIVRETGLLAGLGIVLGIGLAFVLTRLAQSYVSVLLYGIGPTDPATFAGVVLVLVLVALGAAYLPGRRAAQVSPMTVLRAD